MTPISDTQELARRFNEEETIWQRFQEKRLRRRLPRSDSPLPESVLDHLDWLEAEREIRTTRAVAQTSDSDQGVSTQSLVGASLEPSVEAGMVATEERPTRS